MVLDLAFAEPPHWHIRIADQSAIWRDERHAQSELDAERIRQRVRKLTGGRARRRRRGQSR